jgi:hypothetical protein
MTIQGHRIPAEVDWEMRSLLWVLILEGCKHVIGTLTSGTGSLMAITIGSGRKLYVVSEHGGVQRVQQLSLPRPTSRQTVGYGANVG